jgi:hypothetical protein
VKVTVGGGSTEPENPENPQEPETPEEDTGNSNNEADIDVLFDTLLEEIDNE